MNIDDNNPEAGFTLVELVVVLSIVAFISSLMLVMVGQFKGLILLERKLSSQATLQKITDYIAAELEKAQALALEADQGAPAQFLIGSNDAIHFVSSTRTGANTTALFEMQIELKDKAVIQLNSKRRYEDNAEPKSEYVLYESVGDLKFTYLQKPVSPHAEPVWQNDWIIPAEFPVAVGVQLTSHQKNGNFTTASSIAYINR